LKSDLQAAQIEENTSRVPQVSHGGAPNERTACASSVICTNYIGRVPQIMGRACKFCSGYSQTSKSYSTNAQPIPVPAKIQRAMSPAYADNEAGFHDF
jgi:hypothetical protein